MKILLIGASGIIGTAVNKALSEDNEVICVNHSKGDLLVDICDKNSIKQLFEKVGKVDSIISVAGAGGFAPLQQLTDADYDLSLRSKLMGQINLFRIGREYLNEGGVITLTSGSSSQEPIPGFAAISMANGALESFVKAATIELDNIRFNVVSPIIVKETMVIYGMQSDESLSAADTAKAYVASVTKNIHGEVLDTRQYI